jgi:hypothetical protein
MVDFGINIKLLGAGVAQNAQLQRLAKTPILVPYIELQDDLVHSVSVKS